MKAKLDFESQLHCLPIRNEKVRSLNADENPEILVVEIELRYKGLLALGASLFGSRKIRRYELAGLSRELYEKLDGKLTVEDLVLELSEKENLAFLEARGLVVQYLKNLMQSGLVVIITKPEDSPEQDE